MTRATLYCVTDKNVIRSVEYNGDGYPDGYGVFYIHLLEKTRSVEDFALMVQAFQNAHFRGYDFDPTFDDKKSSYFNKKGHMVMNDEKYFKDYFSDWIFIKNISSNPFPLITREGDLKILGEGEQIALNYGHTEGAFKSAEECRKMNAMAADDWGILSEDSVKEIIEASGQEFNGK
jgi:hypothetical protein